MTIIIANSRASLLSAVLLFASATATNVPSYPLNAVCVMTNAARMFPTRYTDLFSGTGSIRCPIYNNLHPVYLSDGLLRSSSAQASDKATYGYNAGGGPHNTSPQLCARYGSCDFASRIRHYENVGSVAENAAAGQDSALSVMSAWLGSPDHCDNIMNPTYGAMGVAHQGDVWVQDFASASMLKGVFTCGGHVPNGNTINFMATLYAVGMKPISKIRVVVDGVPHDMQLPLGSPNYGMASLYMSMSSGCHWYVFEALSGSTVIDRYPRFGNMVANSATCSVGNSGTMSGTFYTYRDPFLPPPPSPPAPSTAPAASRSPTSPSKSSVTKTSTTSGLPATTGAVFMSEGNVHGEPIVGAQSIADGNGASFGAPWEIATLIIGLVGLAILVILIVRIVQLNKAEDKPWYQPRTAASLVDVEKLQRAIKSDSKLRKISWINRLSTKPNAEQGPVPDIDIIVEEPEPETPSDSRRPVTLFPMGNLESAWKALAGMVGRKP